MRFLHAADIHLDSPSSGLATRAGARAPDFVGATRRALSRMIDFAISERVDFVVIAGDLYDGDWRDFATGLHFAEQMLRLDRQGIRVAVLKGNHDAESVISRGLTLPPNVRVFRADRPETIRFEGLEVALHGRSFPRRQVTDNLAASYPAPVEDMLNIGVLHSSLDGRPGHDAYAPCVAADLRAKGYAYWALGHIHKREEIGRDPWIVFPGNLQGRDVNESGAKGCTLVTVEGGRIVDVEAVAMDVARWARVEVDVSGLEGFEAIIARIGDAMGRAADAAQGRPLAVRLRLTGQTPQHAALAGDRPRARAECELAAQRVAPELWLERLEIKTRPPADGPAFAADALSQFAAVVRAVKEDPEQRAALRAELDGALRRVPAAVAASAGLEGLADEVLAEILDDAEALLLTRLLAGA